MAIRKARQGKKGVGANQIDTYYFDVEKCKRCPLKGRLLQGRREKQNLLRQHKVRYTCGANGLSRNEVFQTKAKERYKIEAKNSELKHRHGYDVATSSGLLGMELQGAMAIFAVNLKRILKLVD